MSEKRTLVEGANIAYDLKNGDIKAALAKIADRSIADRNGMLIDSTYATKSQADGLQSQVNDLKANQGFGYVRYDGPISVQEVVSKAYADASVKPGRVAICDTPENGTVSVFPSTDKKSYLVTGTNGYVQYAVIYPPYGAGNVILGERYVSYDDSDYANIKKLLKTRTITMDYD